MKAGHVEKGMYILFKNNPFLVIEREFVNPGKGAAFVRCKLKGLKTGQVLKETIKSHDTLEEADVENKQGQYLYEDGTHYFFMDTKSYEQYSIPFNGLENKKKYLREGESYMLIFFDGDPIDIVLPPKVALTVTVSTEALKGDTATSVTKTVTCDTGVEVKVPGFIKEGDVLLVNTDTGEYMERANK